MWAWATGLIAKNNDSTGKLFGSNSFFGKLFGDGKVTEIKDSAIGAIKNEGQEDLIKQIAIGFVVYKIFVD